MLKTRGCVDSYFGVACNGTIHVLMYSYYLLASLGVRCPWKRYITQAQMAQFVACAAQALYILATPGVCPTALPLTQLWVMSNMLFLFARFYAVRRGAAWQHAAARCLRVLTSRLRRAAQKQYSGGAKRAREAGAASKGALAAAPAGAPRVPRARRAD